MPNSRTNAKRGQIVRLYGLFFKEDTLTDPVNPGNVFITKYDNTPVLSGLSPIKETTGTYYVEWDIPENQEIGYYKDYWDNIVFFENRESQTEFFIFPVLYGSVDEITIPEESTVASGLCRVYEFIATASGDPYVNVPVRASLVNLPYGDSGYIYGNEEETNVNHTNSNGRVNWDITQGALVHFYCSQAGFSKIKKIPYLSTARIYDLEDA